MRLLLLFLPLVVFSHSSPLNSDKQIKDDLLNYRIRDDVKPSHYAINIKPYLEDNDGVKQFTFDGEVLISFTTEKDNINSFDLNVKDLEIIECKLIHDTLFVSEQPKYLNATEIYVVTFNNAFIKNQVYVLKLKYTGHLRDDMRGFYRSSYEENGKLIWIGSTQLQQTHARRVFPCFDEPSFKAKFALTISISKSYNVISNTKELERTDDGTRDIVTFKNTPIMSTYLVAFIVSKFSKYSSEDELFNIWSRTDSKSQAKYSYDFGKKILNHLNSYTGINYYQDMEKMDMAALPDFSAGAMENWGLLTYRETNLLYSLGNTTSMTKQRIAAVIAHEQAHMWFGDLVTCSWWEYTWLNEGFARYFQYRGTAKVETEWELEKQFVVEQVQSALLADSAENTHPMSNPVKTPAEASAIFDNISYNKGSVIITMMENLLGTEKFQTGLQQYLKTHSYGNVIPDDLFKKMNISTEFDIIKIIPDWTTKPGYPLIFVHVDDDRKVAHISQKRFQLKKSTDNTIWPIPLTYVTKGGNFDDIKPKNISFTKDFTINMINMTESWIIFNVKQSGFYRVNYDDKTWELIKNGLIKNDHDNIHELNRAQIIDDLFNLARAGEIKYNFVFDIIQYLKTETNYLPWLSAFNNFEFLSKRMDKNALNVFRSHVQGLLKNIYDKLWFSEIEKESVLDKYNRANIINWSCKTGNTNCTSEANKLFKRFQNATNTAQVPVDIRGPVYCSAIREGGESEFEFLWNQYKSGVYASEKIIILNSLGCTRNNAVLTTYLNNILSPDVRLQDKLSALTSTYTNTEENLQIVFEYIMENHKAFGLSFNSETQVASSLASLAERFTSASQITQLKKFVADNESYLGASKSKLEKAIADAEENQEWINKNIPGITDNLKETEDEDGGSSTIVFSFVLIFAGVFINCFI